MELEGNRQRTAEDPTLIFLHIGKTAGTSLRQVLRRNYRAAETLRVGAPERPREETLDQFAMLPEHTREHARLVFGHTVYGLHIAVPRKSTYITMVREPRSLVLSQYRFVQRRTGHRLHERVISENIGFEQYIRSGISLEMDNSQTRAIAGDLSTPYGECTDAMLVTAKANIEREFAVVGLTERFDETLVLLQKEFGWSKLHYVRVNVAPQSPMELSDEAETLIKEHNRLDDELYRFACERFDAAIARYPSFADDLARFRRSNALYKPWGILTRVFPRRVASSVGLRRRAPRASAAAR